MPKSGFMRNPYAEICLSEEERQHLLDLVSGRVQDHFQKYDEFLSVDKHQVDKRRWDHVKSKDDLHVYTERAQRENFRRKNSSGSSSTDERDLAVMLSVGTVVGELEELMFGILNPTTEAMRIKASYVHDIDSGAILCSVVEPTDKEPFRSVVVKWMTTDDSITSSKCRDFVCIEATDILHLSSGERVGYHVLHSIEFPQTKPLPGFIRGNLSSVSFFRPVHSTIIDNFASRIIDPGTKSIRLRFIPSAANAMLTATNFVRCGQMKKLSWMLQRRHRSSKPREEKYQGKECVMCGKSKSIPGIGKSTCKLCDGRVCYSCKVHERMSFFSQNGELVQHKMTFCSQCMSKAINSSTQEAARDQTLDYEACDGYSTFSESSASESSFFGSKVY